VIVVVSDTSPLNYLTLIGQVELLHVLFGRVLIPASVRAELFHSRAPGLVRDLVANRPRWLEVVQVDPERTSMIRGQVHRLGAGEIEAISLAVDLRADYLLTDDRDARMEAEDRYHLRVTGTIGVRDLAAARGLVNLPDAINRLRSTTLRMPEAALQKLLQREQKRNQTSPSRDSATEA